MSLVRAVAGSGKTTTLAAIAQAYEHAGIPVAGVAPTGAAARVMSEAGIPARTVERALLDREHAIRAGIRPTPGIVLVDEAGTIGTRTLARLAEAVALADAKLVLVGDDAQLPAVAAGTTYADLLEQARPVHTLQTPRRFVTPTGEPDLAEARALANLRAGTLEGAAAYLNHKQQTGTIRTLDRAAALSAAADWHATHLAHGADPARIALIARSQELRSLLNQRARESMRNAGASDPTSTASPARRSPSETSSSAAATTPASRSPTARAGASRRSQTTRSPSTWPTSAASRSPRPTRERAPSSTPTRSPATSPKQRPSTPPWSSPRPTTTPSSGATPRSHAAAAQPNSSS